MGLAADLMREIGPEAVSQRLNARTDASGSCWIYKGPHDDRGRGLLWLNKSRPVTAHRAAYFAAHGDVPDGMCVCHTCDTPDCVNPDHLWIGTQQDNLLDMRAKGRMRPSLSSDAVAGIRSRKGTQTATATALEFGVAIGTISDIWRGRTHRSQQGLGPLD